MILLLIYSHDFRVFAFVWLQKISYIKYRQHLPIFYDLTEFR